VASLREDTPPGRRHKEGSGTGGGASRPFTDQVRVGVPTGARPSGSIAKALRSHAGDVAFGWDRCGGHTARVVAQGGEWYGGGASRPLTDHGRFIRWLERDGPGELPRRCAATRGGSAVAVLSGQLSPAGIHSSHQAIRPSFPFRRA
jgi:hypothetical protein